MENGEQTVKIIAENISFYRKRAGLTQAELAERIAYSDKSVSKWERGEGLPDVLVMMKLAEIFGISLNDLVMKQEERPAPVRKSLRERLLIPMLSVGLVYLIAAVIFFVLNLTSPQLERTWLIFVYGLPVSCIVLTVFMNLWWNVYLRCISVSALIWSLCLCVFLTIPQVNGIVFLFIIAAILQVLTILWYILIAKPKHRSS